MLSTNLRAKKNGNIPLFNIFATDLRQHDTSGNSIIIENVHEFTSIKEVRERLSKCLDLSMQGIQLFHPNNPSRSLELKDSQSLRDLKITNDGYIQFAVSSTSPWATQHALTVARPRSISISPANVGTSGVYFVENLQDHKKTAVFKPSDEEQGMINNPRGFKSKPLKAFFEPGQGMFREFAAHLLDVDNFSKIPRTRLVRLEDESFQYSGSSVFPKTGALQEYVRGGEEICEYGQDVFSDLQIQTIALLDLRLLNCDRNDENVLVVKKPTGGIISSGSGQRSDMYDLIPIDHAYCLPAQLRIECWDWFWFNYPQVRKPICAEIVSYFKSLSIDQMIETLSEEVSVSAECLFLLRLVHHVISKSIDKGLTLFDIASIIARTDESIPSPLERMIMEAESNSYATIDARSSRFNSHAAASFSSSLEAPKTLSLLPDELRNRSYSVTDSNNTSTWNSPTRRAIYSSTEKFISDINKGSYHHKNSPKSSPAYHSHSSDSDYEFTDDASISTFSTDLTSDFLGSLPVSAVRGNSHDTYFNHSKPGRLVLESSRESSTHKSLKHDFTTSNDLKRNQSWDVKLIEKKSFVEESPPPSSLVSKLSMRDDDTPVLTSIFGKDLSAASDILSSPTRMRSDSAANTELESNSTASPFGSTDSNLSQPSILRRMVSFAAVPSEPMYDYKSTYEEKLSDALQKMAVDPFDVVKGRRVPRKVLQQHVSHESYEFQSLRQNFAQELVNFMVNKMVH